MKAKNFYENYYFNTLINTTKQARAIQLKKSHISKLNEIRDLKIKVNYYLKELDDSLSIVPFYMSYKQREDITKILKEALPHVENKYEDIFMNSINKTISPKTILKIKKIVKHLQSNKDRLQTNEQYKLYYYESLLEDIFYIDQVNKPFTF